MPAKKPERCPVVPDPSTRHDRETQQAWDAWLVFRDLDGIRTLERVRQGLGKGKTKCIQLFEMWSARWRWFERAAEWDNRRQAIRDREAAAAAAAEEREWQGRIASLRRDMWDRSQRMIRRADMMVGFPIEEKTVEEYPDGRTRTTIKPGRWNFSTMVRIYARGFELAERAALGLISPEDLPDDARHDGRSVVAARAAAARILAASPDGQPPPGGPAGSADGPPPGDGG